MARHIFNHDGFCLLCGADRDQPDERLVDVDDAVRYTRLALHAAKFNAASSANWKLRSRNLLTSTWVAYIHVNGCLVEISTGIGLCDRLLWGITFNRAPYDRPDPRDTSATSVDELITILTKLRDNIKE